MEIGLAVFSGVSYKKKIECLKKVDVKRIFIDAEHPEFDDAMKAFQENGIICETLHAPFNKINDMWSDSPEGDEMLDRLIKAVDRCAKYSVPLSGIVVDSVI